MDKNQNNRTKMDKNKNKKNKKNKNKNKRRKRKRGMFPSLFPFLDMSIKIHTAVWILFSPSPILQYGTLFPPHPYYSMDYYFFHIFLFPSSFLHPYCSMDSFFNFLKTNTLHLITICAVEWKKKNKNIRQRTTMEKTGTCPFLFFHTHTAVTHTAVWITFCRHFLFPHPYYIVWIIYFCIS
jgi:hypothetical protein